MNKNFYYSIYERLPRQGPGDAKSTIRAFRLCKDLPEKPNILDIGCGKGAQTIELAKVSSGQITAVDNHQPFLETLDKKANQAGLGNQIKTIKADMNQLPIEENNFDLVWSEGAVYIIGLETGLRSWKKLLKKKGYLSLTNVTWFSDDPPEELVQYWEKKYPSIKTIDQNIDIINNCGYALIDWFKLPSSSWLDDFYKPMQDVINILKTKHKKSGETSVLENLKKEINIFKQYNKFYGYSFFVMQLKQ
jgi:SAM-dependent methyltransferase